MGRGGRRTSDDGATITVDELRIVVSQSRPPTSWLLSALLSARRVHPDPTSPGCTRTPRERAARSPPPRASASTTSSAGSATAAETSPPLFPSSIPAICIVHNSALRSIAWRLNFSRRSTRSHSRRSFSRPNRVRLRSSISSRVGAGRPPRRQTRRLAPPTAPASAAVDRRATGPATAARARRRTRRPCDAARTRSASRSTPTVARLAGRTP